MPTSRSTGKKALPEGMHHLNERIVRFNEIDLNRHVNIAQNLVGIQGSHTPCCPNRGTSDTERQIVVISRHACGSQLVRDKWNRPNDQCR
jgi:hypothetical protein